MKKSISVVSESHIPTPVKQLIEEIRVCVFEPAKQLLADGLSLVDVYERVFNQLTDLYVECKVGGNSTCYQNTALHAVEGLLYAFGKEWSYHVSAARIYITET